MTETLGTFVRRRYGEAVDTHGDLGVDVSSFEQHLRRIARRHLGEPGERDAAALPFIAGLHTNDLVLSLACSSGYDSGWRRFCDLYRQYLVNLTRHLVGRKFDSDELGDALWVDLFLPDSSGASRIASYDGRSSLATWLRVVVNNRAINEMQRKSFRWTSLDMIREPADPPAYGNLEAGLGHGRYQPMIHRSFEYACGLLTSEERRLLLLRYDEGCQLGQISRLYSVHQSTITRQLEKIVDRFRTNVISVLVCEYRMCPAAVAECMDVARGAFSNSMSILSLVSATAGSA